MTGQRAFDLVCNAANYLCVSRELTDADFPAESPDAHAVVLLDDLAAELRGQSNSYARDYAEVAGGE